MAVSMMYEGAMKTAIMTNDMNKMEYNDILPSPIFAIMGFPAKVPIIAPIAAKSSVIPSWLSVIFNFSTIFGM